MRVYGFVYVYRSHRFESSLFLGCSFAWDVAEDAVFPIFLLDELLTQLLASGASELDIYEAWSEQAQVITGLHYILGNNSLPAIALDNRFHTRRCTSAIGLYFWAPVCRDCNEPKGIIAYARDYTSGWTEILQPQAHYHHKPPKPSVPYLTLKSAGCYTTGDFRMVRRRGGRPPNVLLFFALEAMSERDRSEAGQRTGQAR